MPWKNLSPQGLRLGLVVIGFDVDGLLIEVLEFVIGEGLVVATMEGTLLGLVLELYLSRSCFGWRIYFLWYNLTSLII